MPVVCRPLSVAKNAEIQSESYIFLAIRISIQKAKLEIYQINSLLSFEFAQP